MSEACPEKPEAAILFLEGQVVLTRDGPARILEVRYTAAGTCVLRVALLQPGEPGDLAGPGVEKCFFADSVAA